MPTHYFGDGIRFQKFSFGSVGEIDFIVGPSLTAAPFEMLEIEGSKVRIETIAEIITKKIFYRGRIAKPRDIFDIAAAAQCHHRMLIEALGAFPDQVAMTRAHLERLDPDFVQRTIAEMAIMPNYQELIVDSLRLSKLLLEEVLSLSQPGR